MASETAEFYRHKNIFITGGTGFLGIAMIEKLLRTTPDVIMIFFTKYFDRLVLFFNFGLFFEI